MKRFIYITAALAVALCLASCSHVLDIPVDFTVKLSEGNSFKAGEPVSFDISGNVDNIVFYSGQNGHRYEFRDRYDYDTSDIESISLNINYGIWYGNPEPGDPTQLETWICTSWDSDKISWSDSDADSLAFKKMYEEGMQGWERLDYTDDVTKEHSYVPYTYTLDPKYVDGLVIAFHYIPVETNTSAYYRRWYNIYGLLTTTFAGAATPFTLNFFAMSWQTFMTNCTPAAHYNYVSDVCGVKLATSGVYTIRFDGRICYQSNKYPLPEAWAICKPIKMNNANPDTGEAIKNLQNVLREYRCIYDEPGTYKAVFVGTNRNYMGGSRQVHEIEFTIQ